MKDKNGHVVGRLADALVSVGFCPACHFSFTTVEFVGDRCVKRPKVSCRCGWFAFVEEAPHTASNENLCLAA